MSKFVPLSYEKKTGTSADWKLNLSDLEKAISPKTRLLVLNNPQNIPGKIYSREELEGIANLAKKHNFYILSDEVYEAMTYDNVPHIRMASLPGMWERTITLGSAGKSFSVTVLTGRL